MLGKVEGIIDRLREEEERKPSLASALALHRELIVARAHLKPPNIQTGLGEQEAKELLRKGLPLLQGHKLEMDGLLESCERICQIAAQHRPDLADQFDQISDSLLSPEFTNMVEGYLQGNPVESDRPSGLLTFVLNNALHPFLEKYAQAVKGVVDESAWYRGYCPVCGGQPDFAYLTLESGSRRLLCSRCDSEWAYLRLGCPFCENKDPKSLGYYPSEDNIYRLYVCDQCGHYLKTIDLREIGEKPTLSLERILTMEMDLAARQMGYH